MMKGLCNFPCMEVVIKRKDIPSYWYKHNFCPAWGPAFSMFCRTLVCSRRISRTDPSSSWPPAVHKDKMKGANEPHCILSGMLVGLGIRRTILWWAKGKVFSRHWMLFSAPLI